MSKGTSSHVAIHLIGFATCKDSHETDHNDPINCFKYSNSVQPHTIATHGNEWMNGSGSSCMEVVVAVIKGLLYCETALNGRIKVADIER